MGRWLSVDPQNQFASPYLAMGNIPTMGVDPDGEFVWFVAGGLALFNAIRSGIQADNNGGNFWGAFGKSMAFSAVSIAATAGIGSIFGEVGSTTIFGSKFLGEVGRAGAHALAGGGLNKAAGGDFWTGAAAGGFSSLAGSGLQALNGGGAITIAGSATIGGLSSEIGGGDFLDGFVQGGIVATANHVKHQQELKIIERNKQIANFLRYTPFLIGGGSGLLIRNNPFFLSEAIFGDIGATFTGAEADVGGFFILVGKDKGKFIPYSEIAGGVGIEASFGVELGRIDVMGLDNENFNASFLKGIRHKIWGSWDVANAFSVGFSVSYSGVNGVHILATAIQGGFGANPFGSPVVGGYNKGEIFIYD